MLQLEYDKVYVYDGGKSPRLQMCQNDRFLLSFLFGIVLSSLVLFLEQWLNCLILKVKVLGYELRKCLDNFSTTAIILPFCCSLVDFVQSSSLADCLSACARRQRWALHWTLVAVFAGRCLHQRLLLLPLQWSGDPSVAAHQTPVAAPSTSPIANRSKAVFR